MMVVEARSHTTRFAAQSHEMESLEKQQARKMQQNNKNAQLSPEQRVENKVRKRQKIQELEDEVSDFRRDFTDEELLTMTRATIPAPNHFHNAQECANKNRALFWLNSGHCFFHGVVGRIPHSSAVPAMNSRIWEKVASFASSISITMCR